MDGMNMDLFADATDAVESAPNAAPEVDFEPVLEAALADAGRKAAMKALGPEQKVALLAAVAVVAGAKRAAYQRAAAGELLPGFDWLARQPALARATALLSNNFVNLGVIPMAPERATSRGS